MRFGMATKKRLRELERSRQDRALRVERMSADENFFLRVSIVGNARGFDLIEKDPDKLLPVKFGR
jgi:hypothetical protein